MSKQPNLIKETALGAVGALTGTVLLQTMRMANERWAPRSMPPMREHPGNFMVRKAERQLPRRSREYIPPAAESGMAQLLGIGYGLTFGALYGAMRPRQRNAAVDGTILGLVTWACGYLGWLPATKLMPPVWEQEPEQAITPVVTHVAFGIVTVSVFNWLRRRV